MYQTEPHRFVLVTYNKPVVVRINENMLIRVLNHGWKKLYGKQLVKTLLIIYLKKNSMQPLTRKSTFLKNNMIQIAWNRLNGRNGAVNQFVLSHIFLHLH